MSAAPRHEKLGDFTLIREIGRGGMGVVHLARQESLNRLVAIKLLPRELTEDQRRLDRFQLEAAVISRLDHPSIVPVFGVGEEHGFHFIAMKYLDGATLDAIIRQRGPGQQLLTDESTDGSGSGMPGRDATMVLKRDGNTPPSHTPNGDSIESRSPEVPTSLPKATAPLMRRDAGSVPMMDLSGSTASEPGWIFKSLRLIEHVARALHHAHEEGVVHRDVKPSNILIDKSGHPWLLDFGLVRDLSSAPITQTDGMLGTAFYMSPEQVRRQDVDRRADIYALGVTLYELVTLERPFAYLCPDTLFHAIVHEEPEAPRRKNPKLPKDLETVILKALSKDANARYQTSEDFAEDLRRVRSYEPVVAKPVTVFARGRKWIHRNPTLAGAFLFALLSFVGMVEYSLYRDLLDQRRAQESLVAADAAFEEKEWHQAFMHYNLYITLGGDHDVVGPRMARLNELFAASRELMARNR